MLLPEVLKPAFRDLEQRKVEVLGGFGASPYARGSALIVRFVSDGETTRFERHDIDWQATSELWNGEQA